MTRRTVLVLVLGSIVVAAAAVGLGAAGGPAGLRAWFRVQHAIYLVTEGRADDARATLEAVVAEDAATARARALRLLAELDLAAYPGAGGAAPPLRGHLSPALDALARRLGLGAEPARPTPTGGRSLLFRREEAFLPPLLEAHAAGDWATVGRLAAAMPAPARPELPSLRVALLPLRARAAFETADARALAALVAEGTLRRVAHPEFAGPALHHLLGAGRADEALLFLADLLRASPDGSAQALLDTLAPYLAGPPAEPAGAPRPAVVDHLRAALLRPLDAAARDALLPSATALAPPPDARPLPLAPRASPPPVEGIVLGGGLAPTPGAAADAAAPAISFFASGAVAIVADQERLLPFRAVDVHVLARGVAAEEEWPVLLLRVQGEAVARLHLCDPAPRWYRRTVAVDPARPVELTLAYLNNRLARPDLGEDRNAFVERVVVLPASRPAP